jgi:KDO2-lipid IV(A) lauroyltransferase
MISSLMVGLFNLFARLPLSVLHRIGALLGWMTYLFSRQYAARMQENLRKAGIVRTDSEFRRILRSNIREAGKGVMELPWVWRRPLDEVVASVKHCHGWNDVEAAYSQGMGVIFLTPHVGCFEVISLYIAAHLPMTIMYRAPRWKFLDILMHEGRERGMTKLVAADFGGVRQLLKALKRGENIGVLPDQVPGNGEGKWASFFGRPAYTMTLIGSLFEARGSPVVMCYCERLSNGSGYELHFSRLNLDATMSIPQQINSALETVIRANPEQYLWSYNRYKVPQGVSPPDEIKER